VRASLELHLVEASGAEELPDVIVRFHQCFTAATSRTGGPTSRFMGGRLFRYLYMARRASSDMREKPCYGIGEFSLSWALRKRSPNSSLDILPRRPVAPSLVMFGGAQMGPGSVASLNCVEPPNRGSVSWLVFSSRCVWYVQHSPTDSTR